MTHIAELIENTAPPGWRNPVPSGRYHLVVIGAGTAGLVSAAGAAALGARVALVEKHRLGGDCLHYGCVPSKALLRCSRVARAVRRAAEFGVRTPGPVEVCFPDVMARMRRLRTEISAHDSALRFQGLGVDVYFGAARFTGPDRVEVAGQTLRFARAVIAAGARAAIPDIPGLAECGYLTNETVFDLDVLPQRLAVIGAGPVGCELAQAFRRFGSAVFLFNRSAEILHKEEPEARAIVQRQFQNEGIELRLGGRVARAQRSTSGIELTYDRDGRTEIVLVDAVLVGVGRQANVDGLGLEAAGVAYDRQGIQVNDFLQTTGPHIYAAGDICSRFQFTHAADAMARIVLRNALFLGRARASALVIPRCTYTDPEVAQVGLTSAEAAERGMAVDRFTVPLSEVDRAVLDGAADGFAQALVRAGTDRLVGITLVAEHAGEIIGEAALALTHGLGLKALADTIHPYPTQAEALRRLGDAYQRTRLTPRVARWLGWWLRWRR